jgi:hypothetical protein
MRGLTGILLLAATLALDVGFVRADVLPPDSCSSPGQPCQTAGPQRDQPGICRATTCTRSVRGGDGTVTSMSYDCTLCQRRRSGSSGASPPASKPSGAGPSASKPPAGGQPAESGQSASVPCTSWRDCTPGAAAKVCVAAAPRTQQDIFISGPFCGCEARRCVRADVAPVACSHDRDCWVGGGGDSPYHLTRRPKRIRGSFKVHESERAPICVKGTCAFGPIARH